MAIDVATEVAQNAVAWAVSIPSIGVVIAYGLSIIRRRLSADAKTLGEDRAHSDIIDIYRKERDELRLERNKILTRLEVVEQERNTAVGQVGKLTAEVEFLSTQVIELKTLVTELGVHLELARTEMHKVALTNARLGALLPDKGHIDETRSNTD